MAVITLLAALWYGRFLEGQNAATRELLASRVQIELALRNEVQVWQVYVVTLRERMIQAGIRDIPSPPAPVAIRQGAGGRREITTEGTRRKKR